MSTVEVEVLTRYRGGSGCSGNPHSTVTMTDNPTPGIEIGTVPDGQMPTLYVNGQRTDWVYDPDGNTLTPIKPLPAGEHHLSYTLTDASGNESLPSDSIAIIIDVASHISPATRNSFLV
jgi:hypothetical protein